MQLADQLGGLLAVLRAALEEGDPAATAAGAKPSAEAGSRRRAGRRTGRAVGASGAAHPHRADGPVTDSALTIGVDVGGTSVRAGVVDAFGNVRDTASAATPRSVAALEAALAGVITELTARHEVSAVGLALAGFITPDRRTVRFAPHLAWRDAPVSERMSARLELPVVVEHDANAAALAERHFGAAAGASTAVFIALGTGIGSALLLDGELFRGAFGVAPELGHLRVVPDGRPCPCGKNGCWERYCSGTALATTAVELLARDPGPVAVAAPAGGRRPGPGHRSVGRGGRSRGGSGGLRRAGRAGPLAGGGVGPGGRRVRSRAGGDRWRGVRVGPAVP